MSLSKPDEASLESLMDMLDSKDGMIRLKARESLVALGKPAVPVLTKALLDSKSDQLRWEAAKTLGAIGDPRSIPALVSALSDSNTDVEWLAAVALRKLGKAAWPALLRALTEDEENYGSLRLGAHHVLSKQKAEGFDDLLAALMQALDTGDPESTILTAREILERMKERV